MEAKTEAKTEVKASVPAGAQSFWEKNRTIILIIGSIVLVIIIVAFAKKKKKVVGQTATEPEVKFIEKKPTENKYRSMMRKLWGENAVWWKEYISSVMTPAEGGESSAASAISARLVKTHEDIAGLVAKSNEAAGKKVSDAFKNYAVLGGEVLSAIASKDMTKGEQADKKWKQAADELAEAFGSSRSGIRVDLLKENLKRQTEVMLTMVKGKVKGDAAVGISSFDMLYNQALGGADLISN